MFATSRSFKPYPNRSYRQYSKFARFPSALFNNGAIQFDRELFQLMKQQLGPMHYRRLVRLHKKNALTNRFRPLRADVWQVLEKYINNVHQGTLLEIYRAILCTLIDFDNIFNVYGIDRLTEDMSRLVVRDSEPCNSISMVSLRFISEQISVNSTINVDSESEDTYITNSSCDETNNTDSQSDVEMVDVNYRYARKTYSEIKDVEMKDLNSQEAVHSDIIPLDRPHHSVIEVIDLTD